MADEHDVEQIVVLRGHQCLQHILRFLRRGFWADETEADSDAMDVSVDGQARTAEGEEEDAGSSLWTDSWQAAKPESGLIKRELTQEREVESAAPGTDLPEHRD